MNKQIIKKISLGYRQTPLGFESDLQGHIDVVLAFINTENEKNGYIVLDEAVRRLSEALFGLSEFIILQSIFWLARELKIIFRVNKENLQPHLAKRLLLNKEPAVMELVSGKKADDSIFADAIKGYLEIFKEEDFNEKIDQHEFASRLAKKIRSWTTCLHLYRKASQKPLFPGKDAIDHCLETIEKKFNKLDAYSLINSFLENEKDIQNIKNQIEILENFYTGQTDTWTKLIASAKDFSDYEDECRKNQELWADYEELKGIIESAEPFSMIERAVELKKKLFPYFKQMEKDRIEKQRISALKDLEKMIESFKENLDRQRANADMRNKSLYALREISKRISAAISIKTIVELSDEAELMYDGFMEELK